jgi:hypothetical protein
MDNVFGQPSASGLISVYVPSTFHGAAMLEVQHTQYVELTERKLSLLFGGATSSVAAGSWISERDGSLIRETVTIVSSYGDLTDASKAAVKEFAQWLKKSTGQEAVLVVAYGQPYFIR